MDALNPSVPVAAPNPLAHVNNMRASASKHVLCQGTFPSPGAPP